MLYTINKPLTFSEDIRSVYRVSQNSLVTKNDEFVSKEIAVELLEALKDAKDSINFLKYYTPHEEIITLDKIKKAITNAEK